MTLVRLERDEQIFDPSQIRAFLSYCGFDVRGRDREKLPSVVAAEPDGELQLVERMIRLFLRANQVNEDVIRMKLGVMAAPFFKNVLPSLLRLGTVEEIQYLGQGTQRRFKLRIQMQELHDALSKCGGDFKEFLSLVSKT